MSQKENHRQEGHQPVTYHIRVAGTLDVSWADWFDNVTITAQPDGNTLLICQVIDQATLHSILRRIRDLGLPLLSVEQVTSKQ